MITCTLNGKKYVVDFVRGRALREIDAAADMYRRLVQVSEDAAQGMENDDRLTVKEAMDVMVSWFCLLFDNQFTPEDMYDYYPADRIMADVSTAILAVQNQTSDILHDFPTNPAAMEKRTKSENR